MTTSRNVKIAPKGMGLNDFVAMKEGYFAAEGLDVEFDWKTFRGTQSSWKEFDYFQRPQDKPYTSRRTTSFRAPACGARSAMPAPGWARSSRTPTAIHPGRSSCGPTRNSKAGRPQGCSGIGRLARRKPLQRSLPARTLSAAGEYQDGQYRGLRRTPQSAARRRGRGREPVAAADRDGGTTRAAQDHRGQVSYALVGPGSHRARNAARLSQCARSRRKSDGCRHREISAALENGGAGGIRESPLGLQQIRARRAFRLQADPGTGIPRNDGSGEALGSRSISQGTQIRESGRPSGVTRDRAMAERPRTYR